VRVSFRTPRQADTKTNQFKSLASEG
jgi:hypothetical protein